MTETSIVIRSFNEADYIGDVLEAVEAQDYRDFETILVDSGSTDGTLEIAEEYVDKIEFVSPKNFTFGYSCNVGCEAASGTFVSFLSAHAIPTDDQWLGTLIQNLRDDQVAMTYSNQVGAAETKFSEQRLFDTLFPDERRRQTPPEYWANNASSAIKKQLWERHQFDEYLTGHEDIEWAKHFMDNGYVVVYEPDACVYHIHDETWEQVYNRFEREAIADVEIGIKQPADRWLEYLRLPHDILTDTVAAVRDGLFGTETLSNIVRFRYNQRMGTASGLQSEPDLEADRYEYFYGSANETVVVDSSGATRVERSPLPEVKPNEVLVRTEYIGVAADINHATETNQYPIVPIGNYVGTVADIGANVESTAVGDVVCGDTQFGCGLCDPCSNGNLQACQDPIELGVDTTEGAYSRFVTVPSDHVHSLDDGLEPREGALAGTVASLAPSINQVTKMFDRTVSCLVVGDTVQARITAQVLSLDGHQVERCSADSSISSSDPDLVVETTGDRQFVTETLRTAKPGAVLVLLGDGYDQLSLTEDALEGKTVINPSVTPFDEVERGLDLLPKLDTTALLDGTYPFVDYQSAWDAAKDGTHVPVIRIEP